jgi:hypothetical protein
MMTRRNFHSHTFLRLIFHSSVMNLSSFFFSLSFRESFASSKDDQSFENLEKMIKRINEHAASQRYAVMIDRTKTFKLDVQRKAWLIYDRNRKFIDSRDQERRYISSKRIECFFFMMIMRDDDNEAWFIKIIKLEHNHFVTLVDAHSFLRKLTMTKKIKSEIERLLNVQIKST